MKKRLGNISGLKAPNRELCDAKRDAMSQMCDEQDFEYLEQRCPLFLYEYEKASASDKIDLGLSLCDNETKKYPFGLPVYGINPRNFQNLEEEVEKVDYDIKLIDAESWKPELEHVGQLTYNQPHQERSMDMPYEFDQNKLDSKLHIF